ncbi:MAG: hypothetical protein JNM93_05685 [Bacteriovoracaceae bacterium]|nr:hypothetical protein [Bacteriovoracaceae bacterium]
MKILFFILCSVIMSTKTMANVNTIGRLGVGFSNQFVNEVEAVSFKIQKSRSTAIGILLGFKSEEETSYGIGIKIFRNLYEEPKMRFFMAGLFGAVSDQVDNGTTTETESGIQVDATFGSEFHFSGIESLGFSMEFGASMNTVGSETTIQTMGHNFLKAAVHFYL